MNTFTLSALVLVAFLAAFLALKLLFKGKTLTVQKLVRCALIAALYTALCLGLSPFSYGAVQIRVSEAFTLLPIFGVEYIVGVTLGCLISNLIGSSVLDVLFGTVATLFAAIATYLLRKHRFKGFALAASLPPILLNAVIIGAMITIFYMDGIFTVELLLFNMLTVGIGQVISCGVLGTILAKLIENNAQLKELFTKD